MSTAENRVVPELFDGERLRQARVYRGLKKVDVAQALGVSAAAIGQYERGKARPSGTVFASISLHLGFPTQFFEKRNRSSEVVSRDAHFRMKVATSKLDRDQAIVRLEFLADILSAVEKRVELPEVNMPEHPVIDRTSRLEIEAAAAEVRLAWGIVSGPIDNVVRLLEGHGTVVIRPAVDSNDVDAFSTWIADRPVVILGSDKDDAARSRFDAAHELGHLVMHHDADPGERTVERQANQFAGAFLMPAETIKREFPKRMNWSTFFDLKLRWHVSLQALLYRAKELEVLSPDSYQRAQVNLSKRGWKVHEPIDIGTPEEPTLLRRSVEVFQSHLNVDDASIASECLLPESIFQSLIRGGVPKGLNKPRVEIASSI